MHNILIGQLSGYDRAAEVGVGRESLVIAALAARGVDVVAADIHDFPVPDGVSSVRDDVFARVDTADLDLYAATEVVYALSAPIELHRPVAEVVRRVGANFLLTTLGYDEPSVPVFRELLPGETLYIAERGQRDQRARRDSLGRSQK